MEAAAILFLFIDLLIKFFTIKTHYNIILLWKHLLELPSPINASIGVTNSNRKNSSDQEPGKSQTERKKKQTNRL